MVNLPANGSAMVLKTCAEKGASTFPSRSTLALSLGLRPTRTATSAGEGKNRTSASRIMLEPLLVSVAQAQTGTICAARTAFFKPCCRSSSVSSPSSRNFSMSRSSVSATCSIRLSRRLWTSSCSSAGTAVSSVVPFSLNKRALFATISTTPLKSFSAPMGRYKTTGVKLKLSRIAVRVFWKLARSRSILVMQRRQGSLCCSMISTNFSVWPRTPRTAPTVKRAISDTWAAKRVSFKKLSSPGVSVKKRVCFFQVR